MSERSYRLLLELMFKCVLLFLSICHAFILNRLNEKHKGKRENNCPVNFAKLFSIKSAIF